MSKSAGGFDVELPPSLKAERRGDIAILFLARPEKRNAIDDPTVFGIEEFFAALPDAIKAVVLAGEGEHFCAGAHLARLQIEIALRALLRRYPRLRLGTEKIEWHSGLYRGPIRVRVVTG